MISHTHKCIFIHIPKTGGSSIRSALASTGHFEPLKLEHLQRESIPLHAFGYSGINAWDIKHIPARYISKKYKNYYKFCFVRNPWDIMVSCYFWWIQNTKLNIRKMQGEILKKIGFENFTFSFYTDYINEIHHQGMGQSYWVTDKDNKTTNVDYIGRFENINQDFFKIHTITKLGSINLEHKNKTIHQNYKKYYTNNSKKIIESKFIMDIKNFNYFFDNE